MPTPARTVPDTLAARAREEPGAPFVTFYDDADHDRIELSRVTFANWVAKTAGLLTDELDVSAGDPIGTDLPPHWLGLVWAVAGWSVGAVLTEVDEAEVVLTGPELSARGRRATTASALLPLGGRFPQPLPGRIVDFGADVYGHPDVFVALDPPTADTPATPDLSHADLLAGSDGSRLLSTRTMLAGDDVRTFGALLAGGGSMVLCRRPADDALNDRVRAEQVDRRI